MSVLPEDYVKISVIVCPHCSHSTLRSKAGIHKWSGMEHGKQSMQGHFMEL